MLVQSILFFLLGFLCAGFIALLLAPPIWRRAVRLTRQRLEAALPLSLGELRADKDRVRAEFAMQARRLEMRIEALQAREAENRVEIGRMHEQARAADAEKAELSQAIADMTAANEKLAVRIAEAAAAAEVQQGTQAGLRQELARRDEDHARLARMYEEASFLASSRQIELVARESELEGHATEAGQLRNRIRQLEQLTRDNTAEADSAREALKVEKIRSSALDDRVQRLLGTVADRDEKLERRERDLARLREKAKAALPVGRTLAKPSARPKFTGDGGKNALTRLKADRDRLEKRLLRNKGTDAASEAELRDQMAALAAQVVHMTAQREGDGSPIARLLEGVKGDEAAVAGEENPRKSVPSLAQRVRSLQAAGADG